MGFVRLHSAMYSKYASLTIFVFRALKYFPGCIYLQETPDLDNTSSGAVAIRKCNDGKYCCNDNAGFDCCNKSDTSFFKLSDGSPTATILSIPPASSLRSMETSTSVSATKRASSRISTTASSITKSKSSPDRSQTTTLGM